MGIINLRKSEQDFYASTLKQANEIVAKAQAEAGELITSTVTSICESHESETPQQFEPVKDKKGKTIAMLWGKEQKAWREGALQIEGGVYPPGFPIKPAATPATNGAKGVEGASAASTGAANPG